MNDDTEAMYRAGVERWAAGDLAEARDLLARALALSSGPDDDWWFAASRALAHVALDQGDLELAAEHLAAVPFDLVGAAQTIILQGKLAARRGEDDRAALLASAAVARVLADPGQDVPTLMNGAIAMANVAELLVELGFADEARRVTDMGRDRTRRAGVDDPAVRAAFDDADAAAARVGSPRVDAVPVERWAEVAHSRHLPTPDSGDEAGYAVVVRLALDGDPERFDALDRAVCELLERRPDLGAVDGTGSDGEIWELYVDGDDPDALWEAIRPLVEEARPARGSSALVEDLRGGTRREVPLGG